MKRIALASLLLLGLASPASAQLDRRLIVPYQGPFPGRAILVFTPADHARLTVALEGTRYHAAFRRAKVSARLDDGAVPGLVPVILGPSEAHRLRCDLDDGRKVAEMDERLTWVLHETVRLAWNPHRRHRR